MDDGSPTHPLGHADTVQVALNPGLGRGTYTAAWHVISADSHPVSGAFTFSVGAPSATSVSQTTLNPAGSRTVGVLYGIARAVAFGGFALLVGVTGFLICCWLAAAAGWWEQACRHRSSPSARLPPRPSGIFHGAGERSM